MCNCERTDEDCDQVVALAAIIGGILSFTNYAYDLLAENETDHGVHL